MSGQLFYSVELHTGKRRTAYGELVLSDDPFCSVRKRKGVLLLLLTELYVHGAHRGQKLASEVVRRLLAVAEANGWDVWLYVHAFGSARPRLSAAQLGAFYERCGFKPNKHGDYVKRCRRKKT